MAQHRAAQVGRQAFDLFRMACAAKVLREIKDILLLAFLRSMPFSINVRSVSVALSLPDFAMARAWVAKLAGSLMDLLHRLCFGSHDTNTHYVDEFRSSAVR